MKRSFFLSFLSCFFLLTFVQGQTVPVGAPMADEALRQLQLQGKLSLRHSLTARPFFTDASFTTDSLYHLLDPDKPLLIGHKTFFGGAASMELLPVSIAMRFNSDHPYGWGEAGFLQAKGIQSKITTGVYFTAGPLSIQCKPEFITAGNPEFEHNALYGAAGIGSYQKLFPGQSSIRLNAGPLSIGLSTESLWWGPGIYNSLLMSNNAPGFAHLTFNTRRPLKTPIGDFEWQFIMGKMVEDPMVLLENKNLTTTYYNPTNYDGSGYSGPYDAKQNWRYLNGLTISYNPKWMKGLFIGINRVAYTYKNKLDSSSTGFDFFHKYFPTIFGAFRENFAYGSDFSNHSIGYKQIASVNFRFVFPKAHSEVYSEYGVHDNAYNIRDLTIDPQHAAAFTIGFKKLKKLQGNQWLDISAEITHMAQQADYLVRSSGDWYQYQGGYTNQSRIIGAGVGSGNNVQTFTITHISGFEKLGLMLQTLQHEPMALGGNLNTLGLRETKWKDFSLGLFGQHRIKKFIFDGRFQFVNSSNYIWEKNKNRFNFYGLLNFSYIW